MKKYLLFLIASAILISFNQESSADVIGFKNGGRIKNGMPADIVIFNPKTIIDNSTFEQPNLFSSGVIHVFVNGVPVLQNEVMTENVPGKYLNRKTEAHTE